MLINLLFSAHPAPARNTEQCIKQYNTVSDPYTNNEFGAKV